MTRLALLSLALSAFVPEMAFTQDRASDGASVPPSPSVTVDVRGAGAVDPEALREQLERELGMRVEIVRDDDAHVIVDLTEHGLVRLRVRRPDRDDLSRETPVRPDSAQTVVAVSLIVSNLVRDESTEVLALLRVRPGPDPAPVEEVPTEPVPTLPLPPPVEEPSLPVDEPAMPPPDPERLPFGIDLAPGLGISSAMLGRDRRSVSFGVVGALSGGIDGWGASSVLDLALGSVNGAQMAGVLGIATGALRGFQGSGVASAAASVSGVQLSGVASISAGPVSGLQAAVLSVGAGDVAGGQLGVANFAAGRVSGAQLGVSNVASEGVAGLQLGVANIAAGEVEGAQIGLLNIASGRVRGLQLGLVNVSERADAALGLVSIHARGRTHLRLGADTNGFFGAQLVHGGGVTHSIVSVGVEPFLERPAAMVGLGFGVRAEPTELLHIDAELLGHVLLDETIDQRAPDGLVEARVLAGIVPVDAFSIYLGIAYRVHLTPSGAPELGSPVLEHVISDEPDLLVRGWPAILLGVELF